MSEHLHPKINEKLHSIEEEYYFPDFPIGTRIKIHTENSIYEMIKTGEPNEIRVRGGYFGDEWNDMFFNGSTRFYRGSMIKGNHVVKGYYLELLFDTSQKYRTLHASQITKIEIINGDGKNE